MPLQAGAAGCCYRMLLQGAGVRVLCALWVSLQGVAARSLWQGHDGDYVYAVAKKGRFVATKNIFCYLGLMLVQFSFALFGFQGGSSNKGVGCAESCLKVRPCLGQTGPKVPGIELQNS